VGILILKRFFAILLLLIFCQICSAAEYTYNCTGTDDNVGIAALITGPPEIISGDTLVISGNCTFSGPVTITNKNIEIKGPDCTLDANGRVSTCPTTIIVSGTGSCSALGGASAFCIVSTTGTETTTSKGTSVYSVPWHMHDLIFSYSGTPKTNTAVIVMQGKDASKPLINWRMNKVKIDFSGTEASITGMRLVILTGMQWGLMDHVTMKTYDNTILYPAFYLGSEYTQGVGDGITPAASYEGRTSWALPMNLGSEEALYIEDSEFAVTDPTSPGHPNVLDAVYGSSIVLRYNILSDAAFYSHTGEGGTLGRGGSKKFEIYNNQFSATNSKGSGVCPVILQENGTGVIYNNKLTDYTQTEVLKVSIYRSDGAGGTFDYTDKFYGNCWGTTSTCGDGDDSCENYGGGATQSYDGNIESTGWPCLDQVGRDGGVALGIAQGSLPVYIWNNGIQDKCYNSSAAGDACDGSADAVELNSLATMQWPTVTNYIKGNFNGATTAHSNDDKDICASADKSMPSSCGNHTNSYSAYPYPHPLRGSGGGGETGSGPVWTLGTGAVATFQ
jgi:hypothetical protein